MTAIVYPIEKPKPKTKAKTRSTKTEAEKARGARAGALVTRFRKGYQECHGYPVDYDKFKAFACAKKFIERNPDDAEDLVDGLFQVWDGTFQGSVQGIEVMSTGSAWVIGQLKEAMKAYNAAKNAGSSTSVLDMMQKYPELERV